MKDKNFKKILVTGGAGYVGSRLVPLLLEQGYFVRVLDLALYGKSGVENILNIKNFEFIEGDIRNLKDVEMAVDKMNIIIHLAAISNDPTGDIDEVLTRQVNFDAVGMLLAKAQEANIERFINASSSSVFGARIESNINELLEPEPLTYYSKYKMLSEWLVRSSNNKKFSTVNIRPATICGFSERQRFDLTVNKLTADAVTKRIITVHGGEQRRPNVGMADIIQLYSQLIETPVDKIAGKTFNFGFENLKVIEIAKLIQETLIGLDVSIQVTSTQDHRDYHISSDKISKELNYNPVSSIRKEVALLRSYLEKGYYGKIEQDKYYNMKSMRINRNASAYQFLAQ